MPDARSVRASRKADMSGNADINPLPDDEAPPPEVVASAQSAFDTRGDRALAVAVYDSLVDADGVADDHVVRFEHPDLTLEVHVAHHRQNTDLEGRIEGGNPARAVLHIEGSDLAIMTSAEGSSFAFHPVGHGLVRLSVEGDEPSGPVIWTDWFRI